MNALKWEGDYVRGSYIAFQRIGLSKTGKTMVWDVFNYDDADSSLGKVRWFGRWRCYAFYPIDAIFEKTCLREIAQFCEELTKEHNQRKRQSSPPAPKEPSAMSIDKQEARA